MPRLRALALLLMLVPGCGGEDEPAAPSSIDARHVRGGMGGGRASGDRPPSSAAAGSTETRIPSTARPPTEDDPFASMTERLARSEAAGAAEASPEEAPAAPEAASARDLPAELSGLFGSPTSCFDFARVSALGDTLNVHVSVTVMPSGRVNRASVSAPGLLPAELACLEQRAAGLSMRGPIEGAPRTVSTDIVYDIETTPAHE